MTPRQIARGLLPVDVLALTLHHEAVGEGVEGMAAVGCVIRNRATRRQQSVVDVCLAPFQFSCWIPQGGLANHQRLVEHANRIRLGQTPSALDAAYRVARAVLAGTAEDATQGADHYYAPLAMQPPGRVPGWARGIKPTATIGNHIFFNLEGRSA